MAGIYIHIPFCKQACHYCDFHFSTNLSQRSELVDGITKELEIRRRYLQGEVVKTIYFGGGTPSILPGTDIARILKRIEDLYEVDRHPEVTLEANPDDLTSVSLVTLKEAGINRLSIGIQSFDNDILKFMNRAHDAHEAVACVGSARAAGFDNISIDLIYSVPGLGLDLWKTSIEKALSLQPEHISCYSLTIEEQTAFGKWAKQGKLQPISDDRSAEQMHVLIEMLTVAGYDHYEVSNFCRPGFEAKHNSSYWQDEKYLGVGPSAHSYDGESRQFNIKNNSLYIRALANDEIPFEREQLTREDKINEYLLTGLRTKWGCDLDWLKHQYGYDLLADRQPYLEDLISKGKLVIDGNRIALTSSGRFLADQIASELFLIEAH